MLDAPLILSVETATRGGSVFLGRGKVELAVKVSQPELSHSNTLLSDIDECLQKSGVKLSEVNLFACAVGPGSFTGLRIGIATMKALAATLKRPSVGIPTLNAVAHAAGSCLLTVALLPAGRGEVFAQRFSVEGDGEVVERDAASHLSPQKLIERYGGLDGVTWAGNGAYALLDVLENHAQQRGLTLDVNQQSNGGWRLAPEIDNLAGHVAVLGLRAFEKGKVQSAQDLSAIYVRPSDPELKEQCR